MKLIEKFKSYNYGATNYVYEFENGLRLIVTQKDGIKDFYAGVVFKAGSVLNNQLNVPQGSTHFLEHLMVFSTSKFFKTVEDKKEFLLGSYTRPRIVNNGATHRYSMWTYGKSQIKGKKRVMKLVKGHLDSKDKDFLTAIEKQRNIIISERSMDKKEEKDTSYNYNKFFYGDIYPEFVLKIDGDLEDIKNTTLEDLMKVREEISKGENSVVVIQTDKWPDKSLNNDIKLISKYFKKESSSLKYKFVPYINKFKYRHFKDEESQDVFISYNVFLPTRQHIDYKLNALEEFANALLNKVCFEYLREDKHLVYKANSFDSYTLIGHNITGIKTSVPKEKFLELLNEIDYMLTIHWKEFLFSDTGDKWFKNIVSDYLFKGTDEYNADFAKNLAVDLLLDEDIKYDYREATKAIKKITREDVSEYLEKYLQIPPGIWIVSPFEDKEIYDIFESSNLYKRISKLK